MSDYDKLVEELARAIDEADCGYSIRLTKLVDDNATYTAIVDGQTREFEWHDDASEWVAQFRREAKAHAILPILNRERLAAAEAVREAAAIAYEVEAGTWKQLPQRGSVVRQGGRSIRALDLNAIIGASDDQ